jgi:hypothetical protein
VFRHRVFSQPPGLEGPTKKERKVKSLKEKVSFHFLNSSFYKFNLLKISIIISMELPMNPLRLEATIGFMAGEPGSSLKIILF